MVFALPVVLSALSLSSLAAPSAEGGRGGQAEARRSPARVRIDRRAVQRREVPTLPHRAEARRGAESATKAPNGRRSAAEDRLAERAVQAYVGTGSQVDGLLGAESIARVLGPARVHGCRRRRRRGDRPHRRRTPGRRREWAADRFADTLAERQRQVAAIKGQLDRLDSMIDEQASLYEQLNQDRQDYLASSRRSEPRSRRLGEEAAQEAPPPDTTGDTGGYVPPVNALGRPDRGRRRAVRASARNTSGAPPTRASASTARASPRGRGRRRASTSRTRRRRSTHRSRTCRSAASQPGDLIFYYSPISHVALYIGGGQIVHARHPGPGGAGPGATRCTATTTPVGAARPG